MKRSWAVIILLIGVCFLPIFLYGLITGKGGSARAICKGERIVSLCLPVTEILCQLGAADRIVAVSDDNVPRELKNLPRVGKAFGHVNVEAILGLEPDIIFCWKGRGDVFRRKGLQVYSVGPKTVQGVITLTGEVGRLVGKSNEAGTLAERMSARIENVKNKVSGAETRPLVYYEASSVGKTRGPGSLTHDLITSAGGVNLAGDRKIPFPVLSVEYIIYRNPDIILLEEYGCSIEDLKARDGWDKIKAVQSGRIFKSPVYFTNYTPRCIEGLEHYAKSVSYTHLRAHET